MRNDCLGSTPPRTNESRPSQNSAGPESTPSPTPTAARAGLAGEIPIGESPFTETLESPNEIHDWINVHLERAQPSGHLKRPRLSEDGEFGRRCP
jgi:hypothetical protein